MSPDSPNFLVAGTQKAGTTWLHAQLGKHPEVFMSEVKEVGYFHSGRGSLKDYMEHFEGARKFRWRGEATPQYFWRRDPHSPFSPERPHDTAEFAREQLGEDVTVIVSLRDPVSRAVSGYFHHLAMGRHGREQSIFRCPPKLGVVDLGFYSRHWEHWAAVFGEDRIHVLLFDDLVTDPRGFLHQAFELLDVDPQLVPNIENERIGERRGIVRMKKSNNPVTAQEIAALLSIYEQEVVFVEELTNRDLSHWRDLDYLLEKHFIPGG